MPKFKGGGGKGAKAPPAPPEINPVCFDKGNCKTWTLDWTMDWTIDWTMDWTGDDSYQFSETEKIILCREWIH